MEYWIHYYPWIVCFPTFLAFYGLKQQKVMLPVSVYETEANPTIRSTSTKERVYLKKFDDKEVVDYRDKVQNIMGEHNLFQKPNLVLTDLAQEIGLSSKQTTELLNHELKTNFYDFVNNYRVEEVKNRIASDDFKHLTILAIGFDSGFQSKSSFNRVFKKITGLSPSEYKKSLDK
jgi:AraC-like DNA-binding protein